MHAAGVEKPSSAPGFSSLGTPGTGARAAASYRKVIVESSRGSSGEIGVPQ